jgi:hypothetical protein
MRRSLSEAVKLNHSLARIGVFGEVAPSRDSELSPTAKAQTIKFRQCIIEEAKIGSDRHEINDRLGRESVYRSGTDMMNFTYTPATARGEASTAG